MTYPEIFRVGALQKKLTFTLQAYVICIVFTKLQFFKLLMHCFNNTIFVIYNYRLLYYQYTVISYFKNSTLEEGCLGPPLDTLLHRLVFLNLSSKEPGQLMKRQKVL